MTTSFSPLSVSSSSVLLLVLFSHPIKMKYIIVLACLFSSCAAYMGYGMMGMGYPMMDQFGGFGQGPMSVDEDEPQYLTCKNAELLKDGTAVFAISVSVTDKDRRQNQGMHGFFNPMMAHSHGGDRSSLSVNIELLNTALSGIGLVAFTTRSQPENGCALEGTADFGSNLIPSDDSPSGFGLGFGFGAMRMGMSQRDSDGVIAEVPITAGRVSSLTVDGLPYKSLEELAGRGVVICSSVTSDLTGFPTCERPFYACCSLSYDNSDHNLVPR